MKAALCLLVRELTSDLRVYCCLVAVVGVGVRLVQILGHMYEVESCDGYLHVIWMGINEAQWAASRWWSCSSSSPSS